MVKFNFHAEEQMLKMIHANLHTKKRVLMCVCAISISTNDAHVYRISYMQCVASFHITKSIFSVELIS